MIIIRGLNKAFGEKIIFSNFNLEIPDGSFVVIKNQAELKYHLKKLLIVWGYQRKLTKKFISFPVVNNRELL